MAALAPSSQQGKPISQHVALGAVQHDALEIVVFTFSEVKTTAALPATAALGEAAQHNAQSTSHSSQVSHATAQPSHGFAQQEGTAAVASSPPQHAFFIADSGHEPPLQPNGSNCWYTPKTAPPATAATIAIVLNMNLLPRVHNQDRKRNNPLSR